MKQNQEIQRVMELCRDIYQYARELNRWGCADQSDIEHMETLLSECTDALVELENTITEGQSE
jgi:methionyl-tRNA synthetase